MAQVTKELQEAMDIHEDWLLTHRVDLHNTLRGAAAKEVNGRRVDIRLSSRVASVVSYGLYNHFRYFKVHLAFLGCGGWARHT